MTAERQCGVEIEPCDQLDLLNSLPPEPEESAQVWLVWHKRHIRCWDRIADEHPWLEDTATYIANSHVRDVEALLADPASPLARRGYWNLGPKLTDWLNRLQ